MADPRHQLFVDGAFADAADGATLDAVSPRDGAVLALRAGTVWINLS
jgi:hypothetical protein